MAFMLLIIILKAFVSFEQQRESIKTCAFEEVVFLTLRRIESTIAILHSRPQICKKYFIKL